MSSTGTISTRPLRMAVNEHGEITFYKVVENHQVQYSIWPADRLNPLGWTDSGKSGTKEECLEYIKEVGTEANS
jgi:MbtH protein